MAVIWKYPLWVTDKQTIEAPEGAKCIHVEPLADYKTHDINPEHWAQLESWFYISDEHVKKVPIVLHIYGTGHQIPDELPLQFITTFRTPPFVWHVFQETS